MARYNIQGNNVVDFAQGSILSCIVSKSGKSFHTASYFPNDHRWPEDYNMRFITVENSCNQAQHNTERAWSCTDSMQATVVQQKLSTVSLMMRQSFKCLMRRAIKYISSSKMAQGWVLGLFRENKNLLRF